MRSRWAARAWIGVAALALGACGDGDAGDPADTAGAVDAAADAGGDVTGEDTPGRADGALVDGALVDGTPDQAAGEDAPEEIADAGPAADSADAAEVTPAKRYVTYRTVGGASMGANALTLVAHNPDRFDMAGSLGGYVEFGYFFQVMERFFFGGFCPMEQLLAHVDEIGEVKPELFNCPNPPTMPYEWAWDFNHWHFDDSGGNWGRKFYNEVLEGIFMALGNLLYYNPEHPWLPPGVSLEWLTDVPEGEKCDTPAVVGKPHNFNAEFNPEGTYSLITYCDAETTVGCLDDDPARCGEDHPDYYALKGAYDPTSTPRIPVHVALAVDYNGNGQRDYGEPIVVNARERFEDTGSDGCSNEDEDGLGGCGGGPGGDDPNGDDFDLLTNFGGTEGNLRWDEGEAFDDYGLDGVAQSVSGVADHGEGNGAYDYNPRVQATFEWAALHFLETAPVETLARLDFFFDGGIRDAIHALTGAQFFAQTLNERGLPVSTYDGFAGTEGSLFPHIEESEITNVLAELDFSPAAIGQNVLLRYGNPDATPAEIKSGDGKHVGTNTQVLNRILLFFMAAIERFPNPDLAESDDQGLVVHSSYYSDAVANRIRYSISLPPGYEEAGKEEGRYPVVVFLPGHGMACKDMSAAGLVFNIMMAGGELPKFMFLCPEGQCCYRDTVTGLRECACLNASGGNMSCVDPTCQGAHETCDERLVPKSQLEQECNGGHFFVNYECDRWGDTSMAAVMRYEDAFMELMDHADGAYRTKLPEWIDVPSE